MLASWPSFSFSAWSSFSIAWVPSLCSTPMNPPSPKPRGKCSSRATGSRPISISSRVSTSPIQFYWLMALAYKSFGIGEFAARFWSAAFATGLVLSIYLFGRQVLGSRGALIAALAFTTNIGTAILARAAVTDMTLAFSHTSRLQWPDSDYRQSRIGAPLKGGAGYFPLGQAGRICPIL